MNNKKLPITQEEMKKLKADQLKMLDWYAEIAEFNEPTRKFLALMATRLNALLHKLDTKENEES